MALLIAAPFFIPFRTYPVPSFYVETSAVFIALTLLLVSVLFFPNKIRVFKFKIHFASVLCFFVFLLFAFDLLFRASVYLEHRLLALSTLFLTLCLTLVVANLSEGCELDKEFDFIACVILFSATVAVIFSVFQIFGFESFLGGALLPRAQRPIANFGQANHYANFVSLGLASLLYFVFVRKRGGAFLALLPVLALGLAFSGSRSVVLYLLFFCICFFAFKDYLGVVRHKAIGSIIFVFGMVMLFSWGFSGFWSMDASLLDRSIDTSKYILSAGDVEAGSGCARLGMLRESVATIFENGFFGVGPWNVSFNHFDQQVVLSDSCFSPFDALNLENYHNLFLQLGVSFGFLGVVIVALCCFMFVRSFFAASSDSVFYIRMLLGVIFVHSMLEYPLYYANFLILFFCLLVLLPGRVFYIDLPIAFVRVSVLSISGVLAYFLISVFNSYGALEDVYLAARVNGLKLNQLVISDLQRAANYRFFQPYVDEILVSVSPKSYSPQILPLVAKKAENLMRFKTTKISVGRYIDFLEAEGKFDLAAEWRAKARKAYLTYDR